MANGGDQRVVENKYLINLSRAPFTPHVGDQTQMLASFVDFKTNELVREEMNVKIRISKLGGEAGKREFVYEEDNVKVVGGVLEFVYTFQDAGLHEIFFDFAFASPLAGGPQKIYKAPDFLLDIQTPLNRYSLNQIFMSVFGSFVIGLIAGWFIKRYAIIKI